MEKPTVVELKSILISTSLISILASNFYQFKLSAPILALIINFLLLLFYRHRGLLQDTEIDVRLEEEGEWIALAESTSYLGSLLKLPHMYWEKFVKKMVLKEYREHYDQQQIKRLLGMKTGSSNRRPEEISNSWFYLTWLQEMNPQYLLLKKNYC
ncbi:unnamed protein product [Taenia asiatica]|uniref:RR_TM4-6 domain-containing protein n=1 Tax=Taenia asiatica TaxID=60517 RepID=A0A0R3WGJ2_TAEAS|nr:unnamed protein product [Taenia asiatica]